MTTVSILVPLNTNCPYRQRAWAYVERHYRTHHPEWDLITGDHGGGPWIKGLALRRAAEQATGEVLVVADADVYTDPINLAAAVECAAGGDWSIPHKLVYRLTEAETQRVYDGHEPRRGSVTIAPYEGAAGGGLLAVRRDQWDAVGGFDTGFVGWGREDHSFGWAMLGTFGWNVRQDGRLWHLYHPGGEGGRQPGEANRALGARYKHAKKNPPEMAALIAERRASGHLAPAHLDSDRDEG